MLPKYLRTMTTLMLGGFMLVGNAAVIPAADDAKKPATPDVKPQDKKDDAKKDEGKKDEGKKDEGKKDEGKKDEAKTKGEAAQSNPATKFPTWQKYKDAEETYQKSRQAAAKEVDDAIARAEAAISKAQKELNENKDPAARLKNKDIISAATKEIHQLRSARSHLDFTNLGPAIPKPIPEENRFQAHIEKPQEILLAQLNIEAGQGLIITNIDKDGVAERAGLQKYDVLVQINSKPVLSDIAEFRKLLGEIKSDTPVTATVLRKGKPHTSKEFKLPAYGSSTKTINFR